MTTIGLRENMLNITNNSTMNTDNNFQWTEAVVKEFASRLRIDENKTRRSKRLHQKTRLTHDRF